jgi:Ca-activated chloride channel homolog
MFMPELGTTLLRNRLALTRVAAGLLFIGTAVAQSTPAPQNPSQTQPPPAASSPTTQAPSTTQQKTQPQGAAPAATQQGQPQGAAPSNQAPPPSQPAGQSGAAPSGNASQDGGQAPIGTQDGGFVFHSEAREVTLHATVVDDKNHLITNLDKSDFTVFENDKPQPIKAFHQQDFPVAIGIVIDNSGSMREKRDAVNKAAINLVKASNPDDQVFVVNFNDEYYLDQEFTSDVKKLQNALEHVEARGGTALYDAIVASADYLTHSKLQRKAIFVVTDGEDDASQESLEQAVHRLQQENGPVVYAIGLLGDEKSRRAKRALELVADRTGGEAFFPPTLDEVDEISRSIARDIRNQYTIIYAPTTPKSVQGYRTIHVDAHAKAYKKLTVRTRSGYYPGQEQQGAGGRD